MDAKKTKIKHRRYALYPHFDKSRPIRVYANVALKAQREHIMRVSFDTEKIKVGIDMMCYQNICTYPLMMKNLHPVNAHVVVLRRNIIRCT